MCTKNKKLPARLGASQALRWATRENWHITTLFLGWIEEARIEEVVSTAKALVDDFTPDAIRFSHIDWGPLKGQPRMIWLYGSTSLTTSGTEEQAWHDFKRTLREHLSKKRLYHDSDEWPFLPHVTIARMKPQSRHSLPDIRTELNAEYTPDELLLMESKLSPAGPTYTTLERFALKK